jgi:hypothetical protein
MVAALAVNPVKHAGLRRRHSGPTRGAYAGCGLMVQFGNPKVDSLWRVWNAKGSL